MRVTIDSGTAYSEEFHKYEYMYFQECFSAICVWQNFDSHLRLSMDIMVKKSAKKVIL